ncbi:MAG: L,D-transpeptidase, partial [Solirubrobacterales bacterium]|nr:L,D-transpeptidase [Solirubrobacterales bacterium]
SATAGEPLADLDLPSLQPAPRPGAAPKARAALEPPLAFHLRRRAQLRRAPGGKVIATLRTRTEFRSPQILAVVRRRPGWVAVRTPKVANHRVAWLPSSAGAFFSQPRTIVVDLSRRTLMVFHRGKLTDRYRVAIGTPQTPTPVGRFAVTDRLRVSSGGPYGCCILALSARQPHIAQGWGGGDRIAIHATPDESSVGGAVSHGCLRATEATMRRLMRQIRLGTPVRIKA